MKKRWLRSLTSAVSMAVPTAARQGLVVVVLSAGLSVSAVHQTPVSDSDAGRSSSADKAKAKLAGEVWQSPQRPHRKNPRNPLAGRVWGVYEGPQDQVWAPFQASAGEEREQIAKIALRPRTKWYGAHVADEMAESTALSYVASSQDGDPEALVQMAVFRMQPWEDEACNRAPSSAEKKSYRTWIDNLAAGIGSAHALIVMQPDGPFLHCVPKRRVTASLLKSATRTLSSLPNTSVYIDAGAADWCKAGTAHQPEGCASILRQTGIEYARGFALDSTHYTGPSENIRHGKEIVDILRRDGYGKKHFIIDTAKSGRPTTWPDMIPSTPGGPHDDARTCTTPEMTRCVTLGIPPTSQPWRKAWGLPSADRKVAAELVDGFVWFGRPWLFMQADPFVTQRALDMGRTTPWPGPDLS